MQQANRRRGSTLPQPCAPASAAIDRARRRALTVSRALRRVLPAAMLIGGGATAAEPFADAHVHYNWDQNEIIAAGEIAARLRAADVVLALATGTPSELALELARAAPDLVVPFFSPYMHPLGRRDWYRTPRTLQLADAGLREGRHRGIGEIHLMTGFRPRNDNPVLTGLLRLAERHAVPALVHVDAGNERRFVDICTAFPGIEIIFAHAGGKLGPQHVRRVIERCANATIELSARDPWRYGGLTGDDGRLLPGWRELIIEHPDRFVTGTDPVWKVTRTQSWDRADHGWDYFGRLIDYHRRWLADLPPPVRRRVSVGNAARLLKIERFANQGEPRWHLLDENCIFPARAAARRIGFLWLLAFNHYQIPAFAHCCPECSDNTKLQITAEAMGRHPAARPRGPEYEETALRVWIPRSSRGMTGLCRPALPACRLAQSDRNIKYYVSNYWYLAV